ncbi:MULTISPECIES: acetyl-CoA carboxylase biotin carboxylase subunit [unclassified Nonomuraea]|uniref:acetyl-CoA carboxylase biotin carboxylase subunit n=1 Tax=unclassified Nonomuraea TaxID=2593643 RepID=UPI0033E689C7
MFKTILVANRGEIALRIVRTCKELGIRVAVAHSTADADSPAVRLADQAVQIGPAPARHSYLNIPAVIEAARLCGANAIHPGYGFLSEDPDFAEVCADHDLTFIGPSPRVLSTLGDKVHSRTAVVGAGLPVLPGSRTATSTAVQAQEAADHLGYPVIIKASAGGGGRGMAVVDHPRELSGAFARTRAEARSLFGDDRVYVERYLRSSRHVEVQVLADQHGGVVHLGERDCSVQRRRQKLLEETPSPGLPACLLDGMTSAATHAARVLGLTGAATFEFLVEKDGFYFMEANCRLQVEHPVTEMVTGIDLVREQILIAAGEPLSLTQDDVAPRGVAVECRVNAEDPARAFMPTPGVLDTFVPPGGPFTRVDTHGHAGQRISPEYDSLLAKVVVWAPGREAALRRMDRALAEFRIEGAGLHTTAGFLRQVIDHPAFAAGTHSTTLVEEMLDQFGDRSERH